MKFAVIGDVLGNDALLAEVLADLARRGIDPPAVVSVGNLVGRFGDAVRCLRLAESFAVCLQGPLERALVHAPPDAGREGPDVTSTTSDVVELRSLETIQRLRAELEDPDLRTLRSWPLNVVDPPWAFTGAPDEQVRLPDSVRVHFVASVANFWLPARPEVWRREERRRRAAGPAPFLAGSPGGSSSSDDLDDFPDPDDSAGEGNSDEMDQLLMPNDGAEWDLSQRGAWPATVHVGSVRGLPGDRLPDDARILAAWVVDDDWLRFYCWERGDGPVQGGDGFLRAGGEAG